jgi:hypothetical protein
MKAKSIIVIIAAFFVLSCQGRPTTERGASQRQHHPDQSESLALDPPSPPSSPEDVQEPPTLTPDAQEDSADTDDAKDVEENKEVLGREFHLECKPPKCISVLD